MIKFYISYRLEKYEPYQDTSYNTIEEVENFLSFHASNPDFSFKVIEGKIVTFKAVEQVKAYRRA